MAGANSTGQGAAVDPVRAAESKMAETLSILAVFYGLALVFVGLRVYVRACMIKAFGKDDVAICLCALFALAGFVCLVIQGQHGLGRHQDTLSADDYRIYKMAGYWFIAVQTTVALCLLKVSIALNLLRFSNGTRWYFWALWATIAFVTLYSIAYFIMQMFQCVPLAGAWDTSLQANCRSSASLIQGAIVNTVLSVSTDVILALLPIPVVWTIKRDVKVRVYLIIILSLGYFAVGLGIVKVLYQWRYASQTDKTFNPNIPLYGSLQLNVGIIAACAVSFRPLASRILRFGTSSDKSGPWDSKGYQNLSNRPPPTIGSAGKPMTPANRAPSNRVPASRTPANREFAPNDDLDLQPPEHIELRPQRRPPSLRSTDGEDSSGDEIIIQGGHDPGGLSAPPATANRGTTRARDARLQV